MDNDENIVIESTWLKNFILDIANRLRRKHTMLINEILDKYLMAKYLHTLGVKVDLSSNKLYYTENEFDIIKFDLDILFEMSIHMILSLKTFDRLKDNIVFEEGISFDSYIDLKNMLEANNKRYTFLLKLDTNKYIKLGAYIMNNEKGWDIDFTYNYRKGVLVTE